MRYELQQDYKYPSGYILKGEIKDELEWMSYFNMPDNIMLKVCTDWFKEVKPTIPEYEITRLSMNTIPVFNSTGMSIEIIKNYLANGWDIFSVRRISYSEVFSVGDRMTYPNIPIAAWDDGKGCEIEKFTIINNIIYVNDHHTGPYKKTINDWVKVKEPIRTPLFKYFNGVPIYDKETYWWVDKSFYYRKSEAFPNCLHGDKEELKYFSSEDDVIEYVLMNKPCLSIFELAKLPPFDGFNITLEVTEWLNAAIKLAKEKLNYNNMQTKPLLVTEDGKNIFVNDVVFTVNKETFEINDFTALPTSGNSQNLLYFGKEENAKEYVVTNQRLLTLNEVLSQFDTDVVTFKVKIIELAKERIKL